MLAITATLAALFFFSNAVGVLRAVEAPSYGGTAAPIGTQETNRCVPEMDAYTKVELGRFRDFITTNFQNKSSTSSLLNTAMGRYRELRTAIYNKYYTYSAKQGALQITEGVTANSCIELIDKALSQARHELKIHAIQTSTVKRTAALIDKYQQINAQLHTLNRTFLTMKAYLDTFASKLPCYIKKSCNKG